MSSDANMFVSQSGDGAIGLLHQVFGKLLEGLFGVGNLDLLSQADAANAATFGALFGVFNGGVLLFGSIILTWVTVFGISNTANDGVVLGKKWSTFFTPLRTLTATSFLIPGATGYSFVQVFLMQIVVMSIGFANAMWATYVEHRVVEDITATVMRSVVDDSAFDSLAINAVRMQICAYATTKAINAASSQQIQPFQLIVPSGRQVNVGDVVQVSTRVAYQSPDWIGSDAICGQFNLTSTFKASKSNDASISNEMGISGKFADQVNVTRYKFILNLFGTDGVRPITDKIITAAESDGAPIDPAWIRDQISQLRQNMIGEMRNSVRAEVTSDNSQMLVALLARGWIYAGSLVDEVARMKDAVRQSSTMRSDFESGGGLESKVSAGEYLAAMKTITARYQSLADLALNKALIVPENTANPPLPNIRSDFSAEDFADGGQSVKQVIGGQYKSIGGNLVRKVVFYLKPQDGDVLWQIKDLGDNLAGYSEAAIVGFAALGGALDGLLEGSKIAAQQSVLGTNASGLTGVAVGAIAGLASLVKNMLGLLNQGLYACLYGGYFLGIWVPMIPYFIFSIGVVGWLILVVETLIAGSLWMVMHLTPDGSDSFIGGQQQGYLLVMSVFFRPVLMVFGLLAAMMLLGPVVNYINDSFILKFHVLQADSTTGILSVAGYVMAYCVVIFSAVMLVFSLPQMLPDRILKWAGAGTGDLGESNTTSRIEQTGSNQARTAMVAGSGAMRSGAGKDNDTVRRAIGPAKDQADSAARHDNAPEGHSPSSLTIGPGFSKVE